LGYENGGCLQEYFHTQRSSLPGVRVRKESSDSLNNQIATTEAPQQ